MKTEKILFLRDDLTIYSEDRICMKKTELKTLIKSIISEVKSVKKEKKNDTSEFRRDTDKKKDTTVESLVKSIEKAVGKINKNITVSVNEKNDVLVSLSGVYYINIVPKW